MFHVGQKIRARLRKNEAVRVDDDVIYDRWLYTVTAAQDGLVGLDDGDPATRWPAKLFASAE